MKYFRFFLIAASTSLIGCRETTVLFIGNSITYQNDMPEMLNELFRQNGLRMNVEHCTKPGFSLRNHYDTDEVRKRLYESRWDFVVLQEGAVRVLIPEAREHAFVRYSQKFDSLIGPGRGSLLLFENYPIATYPHQYCYDGYSVSPDFPEGNYCSPMLTDSKQELSIIKEAFRDLSSALDCQVAPVGTYFEKCKAAYPELVLIPSNDTHPSRLGSFLIACVFFEAISGISPRDAITSVDLPADDVEKIKSLF